MAVDVARSTRGVTLVHCDGAMRETGFHLLDEVRNKALSERFSSLAVPIIDANIARDKSRLGDFDGAIELARSVLDSVPDPNVHCTADSIPTMPSFSRPLTHPLVWSIAQAAATEIGYRIL